MLDEFQSRVSDRLWCLWHGLFNLRTDLLLARWDDLAESALRHFWYYPNCDPLALLLEGLFGVRLDLELYGIPTGVVAGVLPFFLLLVAGVVFVWKHFGIFPPSHLVVDGVGRESMLHEVPLSEVAEGRGGRLRSIVWQNSWNYQTRAPVCSEGLMPQFTLV